MRELLTRMTKVNPTRKPTGRCLACAGETANFLLQGEEYEPVNVSKTGSTSQEEVLGNREPVAEFDNGNELVAWLQERVEDGTVLIAADEDHVFNIVRTYESQNYLIDSDLFKVIRVQNDENFQTTAPGETGLPEPYHYINNREGEKIEFYSMGKAHEYWRDKIIWRF
jgi:hypothetical protein